MPGGAFGDGMIVINLVILTRHGCHCTGFAFVLNASYFVPCGKRKKTEAGKTREP